MPESTTSGMCFRKESKFRQKVCFLLENDFTEHLNDTGMGSTTLALDL